MNRDDKDREFFAISRAVLTDAIAGNVLRPDGSVARCSYSTLLFESAPATVTLSSFFPPRPAGDLPPEAYLRFLLWPDEPGPRPRGLFNVAFRGGEGWMLYGDQEYHPATGYSAELARLNRQECR